MASTADRLRDAEANLRRLTANYSRYLARSDLARAIAGLPDPVGAALSHPLFDARAMPEELEDALSGSLHMLADPDARHAHNERFVETEKQTFRSFFDDLDGRALSDEQREACIRLEDNNLLVACAGSGKTATIVAKVAYVVEKRLYRPEEILVVAFNRGAAEELRTRIARQLGVDEKALTCKVATFHALGRGILEAVDGTPPELANWAENPAAEARVLDELVDELLRQDSEFERRWTELLVVHPEADRTVARIDPEADRRRYVSDLRAKGKGTLRTCSGTVVKSLQEQKIADWLWLNSITFDYERRVSLDNENGPSLHLSPDFYYPDSDTIHEHFAIDARGNSPFPNYVDQANEKRRAYRDNGLDFFETTSAQADRGELIEVLEAELGRRRVPMRRKAYADVLAALEPVVIRRYHQLVSTCIKHIRAGQLTRDTLLARANTLRDRVRATLFAETVWRIAQAYAAKLDRSGHIDFETMIGRAAQLTADRRFQSPYSLVLVDEFQDISESRAKLIKALQQQKPSCRVFAVGDDWQAIYRFAGSDVSLFTDFEANFGHAWQGKLTRTYRSNQLIAETAAKFVQRNPRQIAKPVSSTVPAISRSIRIVPIGQQDGGPDFGAACRHLLARLDRALGEIAPRWRREAGHKLQVLVLWRYTHLDPLGTRPPHFTNIAVRSLSFHRAKGLEADYTVLLDISEGDYGVPSGIEDDELLDLVLPRPETFRAAEERRLFYVALTRARRAAYLLANERAPSDFVRELREIAGDEVVFETIDGQALTPCPQCLKGHLVERRRKDNDQAFRGCSRFPQCTHTVDGASETASERATARKRYRRTMRKNQRPHRTNSAD